ncbi:MAG: hypothetical protein KatS3mg125_1941 [Lysobacterales bacterium]|nr:MAG: hypothetical protein KatS3mg125_1941 [Xanthomonadales bacterium]
MSPLRLLGRREPAAPLSHARRLRSIIGRVAFLAILLVTVPEPGEAAPAPFAPALKPGELTVRLRIEDGERRFPARLRRVHVEVDTGVRCVKAPCPEASRALELKAGRDASVAIPVADWSRVRSIRVEGARTLLDPGQRAKRLADGSFLLELEAESEEAQAPP